MTVTPAKLAAYDAMKMQYQNEQVATMVENKKEVRIVEWEGELFQKIYPVYADAHRPRSPLDFAANFFVPTKYFMGKMFDTLFFNVAIIWTMSLVMYGTLYYELLKKVVHAFETRRKYYWRNKRTA